MAGNLEVVSQILLIVIIIIIVISYWVHGMTTSMNAGRATTGRYRNYRLITSRELTTLGEYTTSCLY